MDIPAVLYGLFGSTGMTTFEAVAIGLSVLAIWLSIRQSKKAIKMSRETIDSQKEEGLLSRKRQVAKEFVEFQSTLTKHKKKGIFVLEEIYRYGFEDLVGRDEDFWGERHRQMVVSFVGDFIPGLLNINTVCKQVKNGYIGSDFILDGYKTLLKDTYVYYLHLIKAHENPNIRTVVTQDIPSAAQMKDFLDFVEEHKLKSE